MRQQIGTLAYRLKDTYIGEYGILDKKHCILWDDIAALYISGLRTYGWLIVGDESWDLTIVTKNKERIQLSAWSFGGMSKEKKHKFFEAYAYIVSKISNRQLQELKTSLENNEVVSYGKFLLGLDGIYLKKFVGGYDCVGYERVIGHEVDGGDFYIRYLSDDGKVKRKSCGEMANIPNLHVVETFITSIAEENLSRLQQLANGYK